MRLQDGTKVLATPSVSYAEESAICGIDGGEQGFMHVRIDGVSTDDDGQDYWVVVWSVYGSYGDLLGRGDDIKMPYHTDNKGLQAMSALVSFLIACAESESEESENYNLFERPVREWAEMVSDELGAIGLEIGNEKWEHRGI